MSRSTAPVNDADKQTVGLVLASLAWTSRQQACLHQQAKVPEGRILALSCVGIA